MRTLLLSILTLAGAAAAAQPQDAPLLHWQAMTGFSEPVGNSRNYLQGGYLIGGGFSVTPSRASPLDVRFDISYSAHSATHYLLQLGQQAANTAVDNGTGTFWSGTGNLLFHVPLAYGVRGYGIAGIGLYHSRVELTQYDPYGNGYYYCDPFSGFCESIGGNLLVSSSGVSKFGWNAGVGNAP